MYLLFVCVANVVFHAPSFIKQFATRNSRQWPPVLTQTNNMTRVMLLQTNSVHCCFFVFRYQIQSLTFYFLCVGLYIN